MTKEASQKRHVHDECGSSIVAEKRAEGEQKRAVLSIGRSFSEKGGGRRRHARTLGRRTDQGSHLLYALRLSVQISKSFEFPQRLHKATDHTSFQLTHFISTLKFVRHINKECSPPLTSTTMPFILAALGFTDPRTTNSISYHLEYLACISP